MNSEMLKMAVPLMIIGGFLFLCAVKDWDWIFCSRKCSLWVRLLGRTTVRFIYGVIGLGMIGFIIIRLFIDA